MCDWEDRPTKKEHKKVSTIQYNTARHKKRRVENEFPFELVKALGRQWWKVVKMGGGGDGILNSV